MAEYDGAVRVNTAFDAGGFDDGVGRMVKAMRSLTDSVEKLGKTIDKAFSGYVQSLQGAGAATKQVETALDSAADKTERVSAAADKTAESYDKVAQEADKAKAALSGMGDAGNLDALSGMFDDFKRQISELESAYQKMLLSGGEVDTAQLSNFGAQLDSLYNDFNALNDVSKDYWTSDILDSLDEMSGRLRGLDADFRRVSAESAKIAEPVADIPEPIEEAAQEAQSLGGAFESVSNQLKSVRTEVQTAARLVGELQGNADGAVLEKDFDAASKAVENLRVSASRLPEALQSVSGADGFQELSAGAERLDEWVEKIASDFDGLSDGIKLISPAFLTDDIKSAEAALQEYQSAVSGMDEEGALYGDWVDISGQIEDAAAEAEELRTALDQLSESGDIDETQYDELSARIANLIGDYDDLQDAVSQSTQDAMPQYLKDWEQMPTLSGMVSEGFERIRNSALTALTAVQHPVQALDRGLALVAQTAIRAGAALLQMARSSILSGLRLIGESAAEAARNITKMTATAVSGGIKRLGAWLSNAAKSMTLFGRSTKRNNDVLKKSLTTILKYGLGVRSFYFLFRKVRQAIAEGYKNLAQYSNTLNQSISGVISSFKRFENQFAASFEPLVNIVAPAITRMIDGLTEATYRAGQFIAVLSGQKTVIRAKEIQEDYAASLEETKKAAKAAQNQLAGFDELNILKKPDEEETNPEDMFETVPVGDEAKSLADKFKEAWVNVDLTEIGEIVGGKLKVALDDMPWDKIKQAASDMGKRLATFLNGLINVPGLGKSLGKSIAEAVNTAFSFLDGFAWTFDWKGLGDTIMDTVETACDNLDWTLINHALQGLAIGLADLLNTIFSRKEVWEKIGVTVGKAINAAVLFGLTFLERFDFKRAASAIVAGLNAAVATIRFDNIGQLLGDLLGGALQFLYTAVTEFDWEKLGNQIAVGVNAFTSTVRRKIYDINWADMGVAVADGINTAIIGIEWGGVGETVGMLLGGALTAVASFIRELDYGEIVQAAQDFFSNAIQQIDFYDLLTVWGVAALMLALKKIIVAHPLLAILVGAVLALGPELGNAIRKMVSDIPWEEVGATVGNAFLGALSRINDAIASVNWVEIGEAVGSFLGSINWSEIIGEIFELALNLVAAGFEMIVGFLKGLGAANILKAIGFAIESVLGGLALLIAASAIKTLLVKAVVGIIGAVVTAIGAGPALLIAAIAGLILILIGEIASHWEELKESGENLIGGFLKGIGIAFANIGAWIKEHIFQPFIDAWRNLWQEHSPSTVMEDEGGLIISGLFNGISAAWRTITNFFSGALDGLITTLGGAWETISGAASASWNGISTTLSGVMGEIKTSVGASWDNVKKRTSETLSELGKTASGKWQGLKTDASKAWNELKTSVGQTLSSVKQDAVSRVSETVNSIKPQWARIKTDAVSEWNDLKSSVVSSALSVKSQVASAFTSLQGTLSGVWSGIRSAASGALASVSGTVSSMVTSISSRVSSIRTTVSNITSSASDALSRVADKMDDLTRKASNGVSLGGFASGGVIRDGGRMSWWDNVRKYASGTARAAGSLFVAGESGPEIVGHVNGRTEVLNESQIASAIYSAVLAAMQEAVSTLGGFLSQQMASNTNALITAIGQLQAPEPIAVSQTDAAMMERLAALSAAPYQTPVYATGAVMPYEITAEIKRSTDKITGCIDSNAEELIKTMIGAFSSQTAALVSALSALKELSGQGRGASFNDMKDAANTWTQMYGKSPFYG